MTHRHETRSGRAGNLETKLRAWEMVIIEGQTKTATARALEISRTTLNRYLDEVEAGGLWEKHQAAGLPVPASPKRVETRGATRVNDDETRERFLEAYAAGLSIDDAADYARVARSTPRNWLKKAEDGVQPYLDFRSDFREAAAERKLGRVRKVESGEPGWQGSAWLLERTDPDRFGKRAQLDVTTHNPAADISDADLDRVIERAAAERGDA